MIRQVNYLKSFPSGITEMNFWLEEHYKDGKILILSIKITTNEDEEFESQMQLNQNELNQFITDLIHLNKQIEKKEVSNG